MNCGDLIACPGVIPDCGSLCVARTTFSDFNAGGRRTSNATGIITTAASAARIWRDVLQSWLETSRAANGDMVIGAIPMPAETRDTARLRCVSNQPVTQAIIGAMIAAIEPPTIRPKTSWNSMSDDARLARARLAAKTTDPSSTTGRAPKRSDREPHAMLANAMARKPIVIALETPVTDQPVFLEMGTRKTGSVNMAPIAMQPIKLPAATMTHQVKDERATRASTARHKYFQAEASPSTASPDAPKG